MMAICEGEEGEGERSKPFKNMKMSESPMLSAPLTGIVIPFQWTRRCTLSI